MSGHSELATPICCAISLGDQVYGSGPAGFIDTYHGEHPDNHLITIDKMLPENKTNPIKRQSVLQPHNNVLEIFLWNARYFHQITAST